MLFSFHRVCLIARSNRVFTAYFRSACMKSAEDVQCTLGQLMPQTLLLDEVGSSKMYPVDQVVLLDQIFHVFFSKTDVYPSLNLKDNPSLNSITVPAQIFRFCM